MLRMRLAVVMLMLVTGTLLGAVTGIGSASASTLASCYADGSRPWDAGSDDFEGDPRGHSDFVPWEKYDYPDTSVPGQPLWVSSSWCRDVNLRIFVRGPESFHTIRARVCFHPRTVAAYCQDRWTSISAYNSGWVVLATNVNDNTRFMVQFDNPGDYISGLVAS
jgi:hypothetical protein